MTRPASAGTTDVLLACLAVLAATAGLLTTAGHLVAAITGQPPPTTGVGGGIGVLTRPANPGGALGTPTLHPAAYWTTVLLLLLAIAGSIAAGATLVARRVRQRAPASTAGMATRADVNMAASARALLKRADTLRPSLDTPSPDDVGYLLGHAGRQGVWASVEDSILILGPPRSGKGLHLVVNAILDAPGPVITTSTRPDTLHTTRRHSNHNTGRRGPTVVFDPQSLAPDVDAGLRWSPIRGCEDPLTAMIRARGLAAGTGLSGGGVDGGSFWEGKTRTALQTLLHAAALAGRTAHDLYRWSLNPTAASDAARTLRTHPDAADGWADALDSMIGADPRTRDSIWHGVSLALGGLADPRVLSTLTPDPDQQFDPDQFLTDCGTLHLLATGAGAGGTANLVAAFIEDLVETARRKAARSPGARLDPPLLLALDEIGNLAPLPSLPTLMAEGGGTGITTMPVLQSLAQARSRWGDHAATAIWDAAIVKVILGGASNSRDLQDLSTLIGQRDEPHTTTSRDHEGRRTRSTTTRKVPVLPPEQIRTLPFGTALALYRSAPPIRLRLRAWTDRTDLT